MCKEREGDVKKSMCSVREGKEFMRMRNKTNKEREEVYEEQEIK